MAAVRRNPCFGFLSEAGILRCRDDGYKDAIFLLSLSHFEDDGIYVARSVEEEGEA